MYSPNLGILDRVTVNISDYERIKIRLFSHQSAINLRAEPGLTLIGFDPDKRIFSLSYLHLWVQG